MFQVLVELSPYFYSIAKFKAVINIELLFSTRGPMHAFVHTWGPSAWLIRRLGLASWGGGEGRAMGGWPLAGGWGDGRRLAVGAH